METIEIYKKIEDKSDSLLQTLYGAMTHEELLKSLEVLDKVSQQLGALNSDFLSGKLD